MSTPLEEVFVDFSYGISYDLCLFDRKRSIHRTPGLR